MELSETIRLLNENLRDEHGAIILYLRTAYQLSDEGLAASLESIARDEMRHYKWLAEEVVRLGGTPTTGRASDPANATTPHARLRTALALEEKAIETYAAQAGACPDRRTAALLARIASDERHHLEKFQRLAQALEESSSSQQPADASADSVGATDAGSLEPLQQDVAVEYTTVLQYLQQSFLTADCTLSKDLLDQAVIEMKHMGWLAEHVAGAGVEPRMEFGAIDPGRDPRHILQTNIQLEIQVEEMYRRQLEAVEDPRLRALLTRVLEHSAYHEAHFRDLLSDLQGGRGIAQSPAAPRPASRSQAGWTVGSLLGRKQDD